MNKVVRILVIGMVNVLLLACALGELLAPNEKPAPASPVTPVIETPITIQSSPTPAPTQAPTQAATENQSAANLEPCSLVTAAEAETFLAEPASAPNVNNGACVISNAKDALYVVTVAAAQDQQTNGILQGQAMLLGFTGGKLDEARMTKLKSLAATLDYKGFFTELVVAAEGSPTLKARLVEDGGSDVVYWAWITVEKRRQGAFVAVRGSTAVNINLVVADTQTEEAMLAASSSLADKIFKQLPPTFTLALPTNTIVESSTLESPTLVTPSETIAAPEKTIVGLWERRTSTTTEQFNLQDDGTYTIEARKNSTNAVFASDHGTFTYDESKLYTINQANKKVTETYYLDNEGDLLVINDQIGSAWTRVK